MMFTGIDGYAFEREADSLLNEGKVQEARTLIEDNMVEKGISLAGKILYARSLCAENNVNAAKQQLLGVISEWPEVPAALELLAGISKKEKNGGGIQYYRGRLKDSMQFVQMARCFWADDHKQEEVEEEWEVESLIDREKLIASIGNLLGKEMERVWPFETKTLAELFVKQGHVHKGLAVYSRLLKNEPNDSEMSFRVVDLLETCTPAAERIMILKKSPQEANEKSGDAYER